MDVVFLLGAFQSFFLAFLIFRKQQKSNGDYILGTWLTVLALNLAYYYFFSAGVLYKYPHLLATHAGLYLVDGPIAYVYVMVMISKDGKFKPSYWLHSLWCLASYVFFFFEFFMLSAPEKVEYFKILYSNPPEYLLIIALPTIFVTPAYFLIALLKLRKHRKNISNNFSYTEHIDLKWLKIVMICLGLVSASGILANMLVQLSVVTVANHEDLEYYSYFIAIFFIGYYGIKQKSIYGDLDESLDMPYAPRIMNKTSGENRYQHSGLRQSDAEIYLKSLLSYLEDEKPYLKGRLSLKDVAAHLEISVNNLSQIINEKLEKNFFDFVNSYRVDEVKVRLNDKQNEHLTLLGIAYDCGFNSKSSFNNIFKKHTGVTPSQYIKKAQD